MIFMIGLALVVTVFSVAITPTFCAWVDKRRSARIALGWAFLAGLFMMVGSLLWKLIQVLL